MLLHAPSLSIFGVGQNLSNFKVSEISCVQFLNPTTTTERPTTTTTTAANHNTVRWRISDWSQASLYLKLHLGEVQKFFAHIRAQAICLMHELDKMSNHKMCKLASGFVRFKEILRD